MQSDTVFTSTISSRVSCRSDRFLWRHIFWVPIRVAWGRNARRIPKNSAWEAKSGADPTTVSSWRHWKHFIGYQSSVRSLELHSKRRYKIVICLFKGNLSLLKLQGLNYYFRENFTCKLTYTKVRHFLIQISIAFLTSHFWRRIFESNNLSVSFFQQKKRKKTNLGS